MANLFINANSVGDVKDRAATPAVNSAPRSAVNVYTTNAIKAGKESQNIEPESRNKVNAEHAQPLKNTMEKIKNFINIGRADREPPKVLLLKDGVHYYDAVSGTYMPKVANGFKEVEPDLNKLEIRNHIVDFAA